MKYLNKFFLFVAVLMMPVIACDTDTLHEMNINPQAVTEMDMSFILTAAELGIASGGSAGDNRYIDWRTNILWCSAVIQQIAMSATGQYACGDKYTDNQEVFHAPWRFWYTDVLKNCTEIIKQTGESGYAAGRKTNHREAARILRAFTYFRLTDFYGPIPYKQANAGIEGTFFPTYNRQQDIYTELLAELEDAASKISTSNLDDGFARADFIFEGDITKWKKWAYSLMLRYAMRISNVDAATAATYVSRAVSGGVMTSNADNVWVKMSLTPGEWTNQNGISRSLYPGDGGQPAYFSRTMINWLKGTNQASTADDDPRLMILSGGIGVWSTAGYTPRTPDGLDPLAQTGMPNGKDYTQHQQEFGTGFVEAETFSRINVKMLDDDDPYMMMNYAEVEFLLAEAALRNIGGVTNADTHYANGVRAAMQMYGPFQAGDASLVATDAQVDAYLAAYPFVEGGGVGGGKSRLEQVGEQLWACHFFMWFEAWNDWRRTGFPAFTPTNYDDNLTGGQVPRRLRYPTDEVANNPNYPAVSSVDGLLAPVWWDGGSEPSLPFE